MSFEKNTLKGQIDRITYNNPENGYTVARLDLIDEDRKITIVGNLPSPEPGQVISVEGSWVIHSQYGEQFEIESYDYDVPVSEEGIEKYLGSGLIPGIGPVMAGRIVDEFGEDALDIIDEEPERLLEVEGIGEKRFEEIKNSWQEQQQVREIMVFLLSNGISPTYASRIYDRYGADSIRVVKDNPYRMARDIWGIGFKKVDDIASNLGIDEDDPARIEAGILYVLNKATEEGHVYLPRSILLDEAGENLEISQEKIESRLKNMADSEEIIIEPAGSGEGEEEAVYLPDFYQAERGIAEKFRSMLKVPAAETEMNISHLIKRAESSLDITLASEQRRAVRKAVKDRVLIITGGPGTGKTTIIKIMLDIFSRQGLDVDLAAPTGRAAKRMEEASSHEAKTIHRLLDFNYHQGGFQKNEQNQLDSDVIIIDEASMLDAMLMYNLIRAVPTGARMILVGDVNQLPPVGAGYVLRDLLDSSFLPVVRLKKIFRQAEESMIVVNSHRINNGQMPVLTGKNEGLNDFYFVEEEKKEKVLAMILKLVKERIPDRFNFDSIDDVQVLSPMRRGVLGVKNLNQELKQALNPPLPAGEEGIKYGEREFNIGDKVMQIKNNYDLEVFNGDIGRIISLDAESSRLNVNFAGRSVTYEHKDLEELRLAYATTVHKSQGSEYRAVVMPISTQHYIMLQRKLVYTALTRAEDLAVLIGSKKALGIAVNNNRDERRYSLLSERINRFRR